MFRCTPRRWVSSNGRDGRSFASVTGWPASGAIAAARRSRRPRVPDTSTAGVPTVVPAAAAYSVRGHAGLDQIVDLLTLVAELGEDLHAVLAGPRWGTVNRDA